MELHVTTYRMLRLSQHPYYKHCTRDCIATLYNGAFLFEGQENTVQREIFEGSNFQKLEVFGFIILKEPADQAFVTTEYIGFIFSEISVIFEISEKIKLFKNFPLHSTLNNFYNSFKHF